MITKKQAIAAGLKHTVFHQAIYGCSPSPKKWRSNGLCKVWARKPQEFRLPLKRGLREFTYLTDRNAHEFHKEADCPGLMPADVADHGSGVHNLDRLVPGWDEEG